MTRRVSDFPLHGFETFDGQLALGDLGVRWQVRDQVPAVIQERGVWIGLLDPQDLRARLEAGQQGRATRDVLSPHLHYCFHDTDAVEAAEFARATGAVWMGVLDDEGELIGLIAHEDLARPAFPSDAARKPRAANGQAA
jgi:CBS domain-containing protein